MDEILYSCISEEEQVLSLALLNEVVSEEGTSAHKVSSFSHLDDMLGIVLESLQVHLGDVLRNSVELGPVAGDVLAVRDGLLEGLKEGEGTNNSDKEIGTAWVVDQISDDSKLHVGSLGSLINEVDALFENDWVEPANSGSLEISGHELSSILLHDWLVVFSTSDWSGCFVVLHVVEKISKSLTHSDIVTSLLGREDLSEILDKDLLINISGEVHRCEFDLVLKTVGENVLADTFPAFFQLFDTGDGEESSDEELTILLGPDGLLNDVLEVNSKDDEGLVLLSDAVKEGKLVEVTERFGETFSDSHLGNSVFLTNLGGFGNLSESLSNREEVVLVVGLNNFLKLLRDISSIDDNILSVDLNRVWISEESLDL